MNHVLKMKKLYSNLNQMNLNCNRVIGLSYQDFYFQSLKITISLFYILTSLVSTSSSPAMSFIFYLMLLFSSAIISTQNFNFLLFKNLIKIFN